MQLYQNFLTQLKNCKFSGDISNLESDKIIYSTDNSIYELKPSGIIFPKNEKDVEKVLTLLNLPQFEKIKITPRGGGTSTNGQSVNNGLILDYSRHMNKIISIDTQNNLAIVEPGLILDTLNNELTKYNLFFPPNISPSNRATIGGMINTDACGKGSCKYGKTSDYINDLLIHIPSRHDTYCGVWTSKYQNQVRSHLLPILQQACKFCDTSHLVRTVSGYNVEQSCKDGKFNLNYLLGGAEGTLVFISKVVLKLQPLPAKKRMILISYTNFDAALQDAIKLKNLNPTAIETVDENVLNLARKSILWQGVDGLIDTNQQTSINIVEFVYNNEDDFINHKAQLQNINYNSTIIEDKSLMDAVWNLRKGGVGLLGSMKGARRPLPFVEDTIVPPQNLAAYIKDFRAVLDKYGLKYGMFGHVDSGCLHVRPALEMKNANDRNLITNITNEVAVILKKHNGILWGEHGKGFRGEYNKFFFNDELDKCFTKIKQFFDPKNQLNPNKIASIDGNIAKIDDITTRGELDEKIHPQTYNKFEDILSCNGNGLCFNFEENYVMCPSYKVLNDRKHSPKGRAVLFKQWLRGGNSKKFEDEVYQAFSKCLGCKACATQCPIKVNIPNAKAYFLSHYFKTRLRPMQYYAVGYIESILTFAYKIPRLTNLIMTNFISKIIAQKVFKISEIYKISTTKLTKNKHKNPDIIILQEAVIGSYNKNVLQSTYDLLCKLGCKVNFSKVINTGKSLHSKGFLNDFNKVAKKTSEYIMSLSKNCQNAKIISTEPSFAAMYKDEYKDVATLDVVFLPLALQNINVNDININTQYMLDKAFYLFLHCTEQTNFVKIDDIWKKVFANFNINLNIVKLGCCGMSGSFGVETQNLQDSKNLFTQNWQESIAKLSQNENNILMATGFSCGKQALRFANFNFIHPVIALNDLLMK